MLSRPLILSRTYKFKPILLPNRTFHTTSLTMASAEHPKITDWVGVNDKSGEFKRQQSQFQNFIKKGGEFPPEKGRYHLYVRREVPLIGTGIIKRDIAHPPSAKRSPTHAPGRTAPSSCANSKASRTSSPTQACTGTWAPKAGGSLHPKTTMRPVRM